MEEKEKTEKIGLFKKAINGIIKFWNSGWIGIVGSFFIGSCELAVCHWISGVGWMFAGIWMWAYKGEKGFYEELFSLYRKHLDLCEKRDTLLEVTLEKLRKYEPVDDEEEKTDEQG